MITAGVVSCTTTGCTQRDVHGPDCPNDGCRGCLPWPTEPGSLTCWTCRERAGTWLRILPDLWTDLAERPSTAGLASYGGSGGDPEACPDCDTGAACDRQHRSTPEPLGGPRIAARSLIKATLVAWCLHLHTRHGITVPDEHTITATTRRLAVDASTTSAMHRIAAQPVYDPSLHRWVGPGDGGMHKAEEYRHLRAAGNLRLDRETGRDILAALADHLARHLDTLLADPVGGGKLLDDLAAAVREARTHANRSRRTGVRVRCDCGTYLLVQDTHTSGTEPLHCPDCGTTGALAWWTDRHLHAGDPLTLADLPGWLAGHGVTVPATTLRTWADRGDITPVRDPDGLAPRRGRVRRFDPVAVLMVARGRSGVIPGQRGA